MADYVRSYEQVEATDFRALLDMMLLSREEFKERYATWIAANRDKYGFARKSSVPQITFEYLPPEKPALPAPDAPKKRVARARAKGK